MNENAMLIYGALTGSAVINTMNYFLNKVGRVPYAVEWPGSSALASRLIMTMPPEKSEAYSAPTAIIDSSEDIEMADFYV